MSKFVTYGATETLDNDQKFIIDSDRTGPGSITAKDAASSFLSKWAGFETFEEAVQNTISNNQEFIDRDTAIRSETAELKKKIVTTFPSKDASGSVATFESEFEDAPLKSCIVQIEPVQDLHGYDHPWPAGGGKNKLLFKTDDLTASKYGMELSYNATTEVITVTGTETHGSAFSIATTYQYRLPNFVAGETYTISRAQVTGNLDENIYFQITYRKLDGTSSALVLNRTASTTFTVPNDFDIVTNIFVGVFAGVSDVNNSFKLQLESGSTATDWTPYKNICPITGWTGCEVQRTGKNLLDQSAYIFQAIAQNGLTYTVQSDGTIHVTGTATALFGPSLISRFNLPNGTYTYLGETSQGVHCAYRGLPVSGGSSFSLPNPFTVDGTFVIYINLFCKATGTYDLTVHPQIELGSTVTTYEPYSGSTYPITFPTSAGTVYGGTLDVTSGVLTVDRACINLTDHLAEIGTNGTRNGNQLIAVNVTGKNPGKNNFISNIFVIEDSAVNKFSMHGRATTATIEFELPFAYIGVTADEPVNARLAAVRQWLTDNPTQLCYELATPIVYHLTPTEVQSLLGTNNVWADTGDIAVEYLMSDVSWYVEKKLKAFQSVLAGVEDSAVASKNYSTNSYLIFNDDIYRVTKTITAGETIEEGVNVTKTTVAEQLMALAQA